MWHRLRYRLFGIPVPHQSANPSLNETILDGRITSDDLTRKAWRTVGLTEQRLREKNKRSWLSSSKG